ncbi:hypothetical protein EVAR_69375_1 [Eumeta japonica]|uniref:Uncharacterized protein n=1 Tax=Eumeta variegata TaxID=151549 RepID=A0A4C1ZWU4_EUMVA|nr:hypothetical protein EVAR_69375_1 [Eumeta japonica]
MHEETEFNMIDDEIRSEHKWAFPQTPMRQVYHLGSQMHNKMKSDIRMSKDTHQGRHKNNPKMTPTQGRISRYGPPRVKPGTFWLESTHLTTGLPSLVCSYLSSVGVLALSLICSDAFNLLRPRQ